MRIYWLSDRSNGEVALVDDATVERVLGVELGYVDQCNSDDGKFENVKWVVRACGAPTLHYIASTMLSLND